MHHCRVTRHQITPRSCHTMMVTPTGEALKSPASHMGPPERGFRQQQGTALPPVMGPRPGTNSAGPLLVNSPPDQAVLEVASVPGGSGIRDRGDPAAVAAGERTTGDRGDDGDGSEDGAPLCDGRGRGRYSLTYAESDSDSGVISMWKLIPRPLESRASIAMDGSCSPSSRRAMADCCILS